MEENKMANRMFILATFVLMIVFNLHASFAATPLGPATWGTPDEPWGTRRPVTAADSALIAQYRSGNKPLTFSTDFNNPAQFQTDWQLQSDDKAGLKSCRRPENVQLTTEGLDLKTLAAQDCRSAEWSTGYVASGFRQKYGFFEARMKIADTGGMNNAFWLTTKDKYEIDIAEVRFPNYVHINLCNWAKSEHGHHTVGLGIKYADNLSEGFHDYGVLWTPNELIFEVDGDSVGVIMTQDVIGGAADIRFSTALGKSFGKISDPVGHDMIVQSFRVSAL
jgi:beta-glucanase (GH16 family)